MARGGVYKTDVEKARASLLAQGKNPSLDALRIALGNTGSKSTIHRFLRELEEDEAKGVGNRVAVGDALQDLVGRLASQLHVEADARIGEAREQFTAQMEERNEALKRRTQEAAALSIQLQRTEVALQAETQRRAEADQSLQASAVLASQRDERIAGLIAQLTEKDAHIASLEEKHAHAREALEHFRTSVKEQREQELRRHEHQVQALQVELRQANETLTGKNHELMQFSRETVRMTEQLGHQAKDIRQSHSDQRLLTQQLDELKGLALEHHALQAKWSQELLASELLRTELVAARKECDGERDLRREAETEVTGLKVRAQTLEDVLAQMRPMTPASEPANTIKSSV